MLWLYPLTYSGARFVSALFDCNHENPLLAKHLFQASTLSFKLE
jgi:hypothetical protein